MAESSVHRKPVKPIQPGNSTSIINHKGSSDFSVSELLPAVAESNSNTGSYSFVNDDSSRNSSALNTMRSKLTRSFTANLFLNHHSNVSGNHKVDEEILKTLYVPDSLCDTDRISPSLWKWINDEDLISKKEESINLPLFELKTAKGEKIEIPHRLLDELNEKETSSIKLMSIFNRPKNYSIGASENRCRKKIPRFFIEVDELHLKPKYANEDKRLQVVVESQTFVSGPFAWKKDAKESKNEFRLSTSPRVAMIFDVPETEFTITLKIISGKDANTNLSSLESNSSSIESFNTQGQRARVPTRLVQSIFRHRRETTAANILLTEDGVARSTKGENEVVCQLGFTFPSDRAWPKVAGSYPLNSFTKGPRKEVGKVSLQMGLFLDEEYLYEEPLVEENAEYFDVYIHTSRASVSFGLNYDAFTELNVFSSTDLEKILGNITKRKIGIL
ncbi:hypothetical protein HK098_003611 [Nowakowskiella sp. JEL0407]|nr:hypothetical protein HK098_003611 [Nowakowskiella sp. JEL0407]